MAVQNEPSGYRVLARKYRPSSFDGLIGQEALVRTLSNAIQTGRLAHAFMLTGVRGIGKTTTARIIARALNCTGPDGAGGPTVSPCGACQNCIAIAEDRHIDVAEMDAASRTGVDDIRELIEGVRYRPVSARYKIYIIDEVHMLSKNAFNALLKTLEEPPEHVKFVFATTEIRKVPVTVLSRCQRFDLRRVEMDRLAQHFRDVAEKEQVPVEDEALRIIARAADGSVRDGLSLLDQAMAYRPVGGEAITAAQVRDMLGLADRGAVFDLFDALMAGDAKGALDRFDGLYRDGADPVIVLQDLLEATYWLTRIKAAPEVADAPYTPETERTRGRAIAARLGMPILARAWQMLLKGLGEVQAAPQPRQAAEMVLVRLAYAAELPPPGELVKALRDAPQDAPDPGMNGTSAAGASASVGGTPRPVSSQAAGRGASTRATMPAGAVAEAPPSVPVAPAPEAVAPPEALPRPRSFAEAVDLFRARREMLVHTNLVNHAHLVRFEEGRIELRPTQDAPRDLANRTATLLSDWTGRRWVVSISGEEGAPTLAEQARAEERQRFDEAAAHPLVKAVKTVFPGAAVVKVVPRESTVHPDGLAADDSGDFAVQDPDDEAETDGGPPAEPDFIEEEQA